MMNSLNNNLQINDNAPGNTRLLAQLKSLDLAQASLSYKISPRQKRTLIFVQITPSNQKITLPPLKYRRDINEFNNDIDEIDNSFEPDRLKRYRLRYKNRINNIKQIREIEKKPKIESYIEQSEIEDVYFADRQKLQKIQDNVTFVIIFYHDLFPYEPPLVTITNYKRYPPINDFRNYYYEIMEVDRWWPLVTLQDILNKLPRFAYNISNNCRSGLPQLTGSYSLDHPLWETDVSQLTSSLLVMQGRIKVGKGLMSVYQNKRFGLSYHSVILFNEDDNCIQIQRSWSLQQITSFKYRNGKKHVQYSFIFNQDEYLSFKLPLSYYPLILQSIKIDQKEKEKKDKQEEIPLVQLCTQLIADADVVGDLDAVNWGKEKLKQLNGKAIL